MIRTDSRLIVLIVLLAGCGERPETQAADEPAAEWRLSSLPAVDIGLAQGDERYELSGATSSLQLEDGRIVVANSGTNELRFFDREGRFLETAGRKGEGPGEFSGALHLNRLTDQHFAVYDQSQQRLSLFDSSGAFLRDSRVVAEGIEAFPLSVWLHGSNWIVGPEDTLRRSEVARVVGAMPAVPPGSYRFVQVAEDGRIWAHEREAGPSDSLPPWKVYSPSGKLLARIALPAGGEVHQIGPDFITLRRWADHDVEHIQLFRIEGVTGIPDSSADPEPITPPPSRARTARDSATVGEMRTAIGNLVTAQEMFYADSARYAERAEELDWDGPQEAALHLMAADKRGWVGLLVHRTGPFLCGMAVGGSTPPGWIEGSPKCSK